MRKLTLLVISTAMTVAFADAQAPATPPPDTPPPVLTGNFGGGLALTSGNSDTKNFNISFALVRDPKTKSVIKWNGLYLRGDNEGTEITDRATTTLRDEYTVSKRAFVYGQLDYLRDRFKDIIFLWSPSAGVGYKLIDTDTKSLTIDNGLGAVWEKNPGRATTSSAAYSAAQRLNWKLSKTSTINESISGLWKLNQLSDTLYNFTFGIAASVTRKIELKFEVVDLYKNRPVAGLKKNDVALVTAIVTKF